MRNKAGFTLVEVQIALVILLLIVGVVMGGLRLATKTTHTAEKLIKQTSEFRIVSKLLSQQISSLIPLKGLKSGKKKLVFKGESEGLYYMGYLPENTIIGGPWLIHIHSHNNQLRFSYKAFDNSQSIQDNISGKFASIAMLDEIETVSIMYKAVNGSWLSQWDDDDDLPVLIQFQLKQARTNWPKIILPIHSYAASYTPYHLISIK